MKIPVVAIFVLALVPTISAQSKSKSKPIPAPQGSQEQKWDGKLVDAVQSGCGVEVANSVPRGMCPVSVHTVNFGLLMPDGKVAKFDGGGNAKAIEALRNSKKGSKTVINFWKTGKNSAQVTATVAGTMTGDTLNVESVRIE